MLATSRWLLRRSLFIPAAGALLSATSPSNVVPSAADPYATIPLIVTTVITGTVRDANTGKPLDGASVVATAASVASGVAGTSATTRADGRYLISVGVARGTNVTLTARRIGYGAANVTVKLSADTVRADLLVSPAQVRLSDLMAAGAAKSSVSATTAPAPTYRPMTFARAMRKDEAPRERRPAMGRQNNEIDRSVRDSSAPGTPPGNREQYDRIEDNPFLAVNINPRSTFSIDVDRASYGNVRRFITQGQAPPADAVRIEELVNYFPYELESPRGSDPIAITTEVAPAPWQTKHRLVRIALQARRIETEALPPNNLVFLIDVSGSMESPEKLPLVKESLRLLVNQLRPQDRVALVVYAGQAGLVLPSTPGSDKARIAEAIDRLEAGGSTAGGAGIELAYKTARENFMKNGNNRVILATDGDFNVGASSDGEMERLIEGKRSEGTYLTVLGFGTGNYQDAKMEKLAKKGNGNYAYVDNIDEARKTLVHELGATLVTVANDVKLQVEFNPAAVRAFRLIGYEDRLLRDEDFIDDKKDAGDIGAGHTVTALYEVVPVGVIGTTTIRGTDTLRYTVNTPAASQAATRGPAGELLYVKLRYKRPGESTSKLMTEVVQAKDAAITSNDFRFAASVASFGMMLRNSEYKGSATGAMALQLARGALGEDVGGYRAEYVRILQRWSDGARTNAGR